MCSVQAAEWDAVLACSAHSVTLALFHDAGLLGAKTVTLLETLGYCRMHRRLTLPPPMQACSS